MGSRERWIIVSCAVAVAGCAEHALETGEAAQELLSVCLNSDGELPDLPEGVDLGFRYQLVDGQERGVCKDRRGNLGLNPSCMGECGDMRGWSLPRQNLQFQRWDGADLSFANLGGANLGRASLHGVTAIGTNFGGARFQGSDLGGIDARHARFTDAVLAQSWAGYGDFRGALMDHVWWAAFDVVGSDFRGADLRTPWSTQYASSCAWTETASCFRSATFNRGTVLFTTASSAKSYYRMTEDPAPSLVGMPYVQAVHEAGATLRSRAGTDDDAPQTVEERLQQAIEIVREVLALMGLEMPDIVLAPNSSDAHAQGTTITIGDQLVASLSVNALAQVLAHEAGHIYEGHTGLANSLIQAMYEAGLLTTEQYNELMRNDERVADVWAAVTAWLTDPNDIAGFVEFLTALDEPESSTHPDSRERAQNVQALFEALNQATAEAFFEGLWGNDVDREVPEAGEFDGGDVGWRDFNADFGAYDDTVAGEGGWDEGGGGWDGGEGGEGGGGEGGGGEGGGEGGD
jgi:uncharacterized protein YjbI with pentapeptide repeats